MRASGRTGHSCAACPGIHGHDSGHQGQIAHEIGIALERLGADEELLAVVGSWRDTLPDAEVLALLQDYNATGRVLHRPQ